MASGETASAAAEETISAVDPDWSREALANRWQWEPGRQLLGALRRYQASRGLRARLAVVSHRFWSAVSGADVPLDCQIEGGLLLPHPNGVVIHPRARIGPNCLLFQQVTVGEGPRPGCPVLEGHVDVGAGAKILGGIRVGAHAKIGANAVVLEDVPSGGVVVGVPGRLVSQEAR